MEILYEKLDTLKGILNNTECIKELQRLYKEINNDKELVSLIEKYNYSNDERIKEEILKSDLVREYKHYEAELNFIILEINQELKKITKKDKCGV